MAIRRTSRLAAASLLAAALALCGGACGDERPTGPGGTTSPDTLRVLVRHRDTGAAVGGVKLVLMAADGRPAAPPALSDDRDGARFAVDASADPLHLVAFGGDSLLVHELPAVPSPPARATTTVTVLVGTRTQPGGLPRLAGTVVDAATGLPLASAFTSLSPYLGAYVGRTEPSDDVTLGDGAFRASGVPFAIDPISGNLRQILPLLVTCAGYLPRAYAHEPAPGSHDLDIDGVVIALQRDPGGDAVLRGVVRFGEAPVADLPIGLGALGDPAVGVSAGAKSGVGQPGRVARTDQDGQFVFTALPAGAYALHAAYLPDDGWLMPSQPAGRAYALAPGETLLADTLQVIRAIAPLVPLGPQDAAPDRFAWQAVAEADSYAVRLDGALLAVTGAPEAIGLELDGLAAGWHAWTVTAFTVEGRVVGSSETFARFRMPPPPARR